MIKKEEILAMLRDGKEAEDIAQQLIDALNDAQADYENEKAKEAAAKAKAEQIKAKKILDLQTILDLIHDFCLEYYCEDNKDIDVLEKAFEDLTAEKVLKQVEDIADSVIKFLDGGMFQFTIPAPKKPAIGNKNPDQVLKHFLKTMGL